VVIHHRREDVELVRRAERSDRLERRERLVTEFRAEPRLDRVVGAEILRAVPDLPVVHVAAGVVVPAVVEVVRAAAGGARPEHPFRVERGHPALEFAVEPVVVDQIGGDFVLVIPARRADHLVVAAPHRQ